MRFAPQPCIPAIYMRGGTSKGVFLRRHDLPPAAQVAQVAGAARDASPGQPGTDTPGEAGYRSRPTESSNANRADPAERAPARRCALTHASRFDRLRPICADVATAARRHPPPGDTPS